MIILIRLRGGFTSDDVLLAFLVGSKCAWCGGRKTCGAAVTHEIALVEEFDEGVFAVAGDGAGIANCSWSIGFRVVGWRCVAGKAGEEELAQRSKILCAGVDFL